LEGGDDCTFERLVYECFTRFPYAFGLKRYPEWPDSARVNKAWHRCRTDKGWITGSVQEGFRLTIAGELVAASVTARLVAGTASTERTGSGTRTRERYEALLRNLRRDALYQRFLGGPNGFEPSDMELRQLLGATLETPTRILKQNLNAYKSAARAYEDDEVLDFLAACERIMPR
jgi:hypothetical protein